MKPESRRLVDYRTLAIFLIGLSVGICGTIIFLDVAKSVKQSRPAALR